MFLLVPAYPGSPGQTIVCVCACACACACVCAVFWVECDCVCDRCLKSRHWSAAVYQLYSHRHHHQFLLCLQLQRRCQLLSNEQMWSLLQLPWLPTVDKSSCHQHRSLHQVCLHFLFCKLPLCYAVYNLYWISLFLFTSCCLQCFDAVGWAAGRASGL